MVGTKPSAKLRIISIDVVKYYFTTSTEQVMCLDIMINAPRGYVHVTLTEPASGYVEMRGPLMPSPFAGTRVPHAPPYMYYC